jgi:hypothetical protein
VRYSMAPTEAGSPADAAEHTRAPGASPSRQASCTLGGAWQTGAGQAGSARWRLGEGAAVREETLVEPENEGGGGGSSAGRRQLFRGQ